VSAVPKRHSIQRLGFDLLHFGIRGSEVRILSPRPFIIVPDGQSTVTSFHVVTDRQS
jgi:hypothetical protein